MKTTFALYLTLIVGIASTVPAAGETRCVNVNNANPSPPYTNWATAATTIQQAVNAAVSGDTVRI